MMGTVGMVYPPVPMFAAAALAGYFFRGRPQPAALAGAIAGLAGGLIAERAYHLVRVNKAMMNWTELSGWEQVGLSAAEMLLYTSLLSFFAAFISWGMHKEQPAEDVKPVTADFGKPKELKVELPLFKPEPEANKPEKKK